MSRAESLAFWSGVTAVVLTALAALVGLFAWYWGNRASDEKDERAKALELRMSEQQERAANAERTLLELQERARPRSLSISTRQSMINTLRAHVSEGVTDIEFVGGSAVEPMAFAEQLRDVLEESGWAVGSFDGGPVLGGAPVGVVLFVRAGVAVPPRATVLRGALAAAGIRVVIEESMNGHFKAGSVTLLVGIKE